MSSKNEILDSIRIGTMLSKGLIGLVFIGFIISIGLFVVPEMFYMLEPEGISYGVVVSKSLLILGIVYCLLQLVSIAQIRIIDLVYYIKYGKTGGIPCWDIFR